MPEHSVSACCKRKHTTHELNLLGVFDTVHTIQGQGLFTRKSCAFSLPTMFRLALPFLRKEECMYR